MTIRTQYHGTITCTKETAKDLALVFCRAMDSAIVSKDYKEAKRLAVDVTIMYEAIDGYCDVDYKGIVEKAVNSETQKPDDKEVNPLSKSNTVITMNEFKEIKKSVEISNMRVNENGEVAILGYYEGEVVLYYINIQDFCTDTDYKEALFELIEGSILTQGQIDTLDYLTDVSILCFGVSEETRNYCYSIDTNIGTYDVYSLG